jgi:hypothetical protein
MEFENSNKLKGYLSGEAKRLQVHSNKIYTMYFIRRFLEKLYRNDKDNFVIKGSVSQLANMKTFTRPLTDIDAVSPMDLTDSSYALEKIINIQDDPIKYKFIQKFITTRDTACIRILCSFDKIQHTISFDLKRDESIHFVTGNLPTILRKDNALVINHITAEQNIANKMYVILKNAELNNKINKQMRRFKDFYDLYNLIEYSKFDINLVKQYFEENVQKYGEIDLKNVDLDLLGEDFVADNQVAFDEDRIKYAFLKDMSFEDLSVVARVVIEDTLGKSK